MSEVRRPTEFGSFITPSAASPGAAVELAVVADQSGLDLVSFRTTPTRHDREAVRVTRPAGRRPQPSAASRISSKVPNVRMASAC